jgi:hypothetical protein
MSNQPENDVQQPLTPEEVRQYTLAEIEATKQVIAELSDEELEEIAGAGPQLSGMIATYKFARSRQYSNDGSNGNGVIKSLQYAWNNGGSAGKSLAAQGKTNYKDMLTHMHQFGGSSRNSGSSVSSSS